MKIGHTKTHTVDSASLKNMLRNHKTPTDENSGYQQRKDPIFSTGISPFGNRVLGTANHELGPTMTVSYPEKSKAQCILDTGSSQTKTEESISADVYSDMVSKISVLNGEIANYKNREKKFMAKIYALENEKGLLIQALEQSQKKLQDTVTKAKDDKKKMTSVIDSYKISMQNFEKQRPSQTVDSTQASSLNSNKNTKLSIYNSEYFSNFETLLQKFEEISQSSTALIEENNQIKTDLENYKKYSESLKNYVEHHKSQMKKQENIHSTIVEKSKSILTENLCFKQYLRNNMISNKENDLNQYNKSSKQTKANKGLPLPSYLKALSMAIPEREEQES